MSLKPCSFDLATSRAVIGDDAARVIEAKARADADAKTYSPPATAQATTYWDAVKAEMTAVIYGEQFARRTARNMRKEGRS